ncbi:MAG: hypothetical protein AAGA54_07755 [Myxococcota bacterium]
MKRTGLVLGISLTVAAGATGCDGRSKAMERQVDGVAGDKAEKAKLPEPGPSDPIRDQLEPVLSKVYPLNQVPRIIQADGAPEDGSNYELEAGVAAVVKFAPGLSEADKVKAVVRGVAEADSWAFRKNARRDYADLVHRVLRGYGKDQRDQIVKIYAELKLLQFFNSEEAGPAIAALPANLQAPVKEMQTYYVENKEKVWEDWMGVKMYARRVVAGDEPFRSVLRTIKKELGQEEPPPRTWEESMDPAFVAWAGTMKGNDELMAQVTNMKELRDRQEWLTDTHSLWLMQGSDKTPPKAKNLKIEKELGFGVLREDLGGGHNELTFVFSKKLSGAKLKKAFVRSVIYGHLLHDFGMLATAGSDWAKRNADNMIDAKTAMVPDEYDPLYAKCGSGAAVDSLIKHFKNDYKILEGMSGAKDEEAILNAAHKCVIAGADGKVHVPAKGDEKDVEGPAPGSRLALFQMLARYEKLDVDLAAMGNDKPTEEDDTIAEQEALLKSLSNK